MAQGRLTIAALAAVTAFAPGLTLAQSGPLALRVIPKEDFFLIDAQCAAAFRLMADFGAQRNSPLAELYAGAAGFMAGNAVAQHQEEFASPPETAKALVQTRVLSEHQKYLDGLQNQDPDTGAQELQRFTQDVTFCNARLQAYEAKITEAK